MSYLEDKKQNREEINEELKKRSHPHYHVINSWAPSQSKANERKWMNKYEYVCRRKIKPFPLFHWVLNNQLREWCRRARGKWDPG